MGYKCATAVPCYTGYSTNKSDEKIPLFVLPWNNKPLLDKWIRKISRAHFKPSKYTSVCALHFHDSDFGRDRPKGARNYCGTMGKGGVPDGGHGRGRERLQRVFACPFLGRRAPEAHLTRLPNTQWIVRRLHRHFDGGGDFPLLPDNSISDEARTFTEDGTHQHGRPAAPSGGNVRGLHGSLGDVQKVKANPSVYWDFPVCTNQKSLFCTMVEESLSEEIFEELLVGKIDCPSQVEYKTQITSNCPEMAKCRFLACKQCRNNI